MSTQPLKQQPRRYLTERQQLALALQESTIDFVPADVYDNDDDSSSDSESSNEDEDEDYLKNNNKLSLKKVRLPPMSRQQKELASLAPWAWDPLVSRHAPGPSALRDFSEVLTSVRKAGGMKIEEQLPTREQQSNKSNKQTKATMKSEKKAAATVATINDKENKVPKKDISANAKNSNNNNNKKNKKSSLGVSSSALITKTNEKNNSNTKKQSTAVVVVAQQAAEKVVAALTTLTTTSKKGGCKNSKQARDEEKKAAAEATRAQEEKEEKVSPAAEVLLPTTTTKRTTKKRTPVMKKRGAGGGLKKHQEAFDEEDSIATTEEPKTAPQKRAQKSEQITPVAFELDAKVSAPKNSTHTKKNKKVVVDVKMSTAEKKLLLAKERGDKTQQLQGKKIQTPIGATNAAKKKLVLQTPLNEKKSDTTIAKAVAAVEEANKLLSPTARRITSSAAKTLPSKKRPRTFSIDIANDVVLVGKPSPLQHLNQEQQQQQQQQQQQHQTMMTEEEKKERRDKFWIFLDTLQIKPPKEGNAGKKESLSASQKLFESFCFATGRKEKKSMMTTTVSVTKTKEREQDFICATTTTTTTTTLFNSETDYAVPVGKRVRLVPMSHALKVACTQLLMSATSSSPP